MMKIFWGPKMHFQNIVDGGYFKKKSNFNFYGNTICAAGFALLNLPKGKSLGRSKPATNSSNEQAH